MMCPRLAVTLVLGSMHFAAFAVFADEPKAGDTSLSFTEKSPLSDPAKITRRAGWSLDSIRKQIDIDYDLSKETYSAYVPQPAADAAPYGLMVWISAGPKGDVPERWKPVLDKRHLIWIGANHAGNPRAILIRMGLALDAVSNMKARYAIDDRRIYVAGASGGGKVATILGVAWADAFRGGFYMIGTAHYRNIPTGEPDHFWPKGFNAPQYKLMADARQQSRHVFLTGEKDVNRKPTLGMFEAYKADKFQHLTLIDIPGAGHELPDAERFGEGIAALEEIPAKGAK